MPIRMENINSSKYGEGNTVDSSGITKEVTWTQTSWLDRFSNPRDSRRSAHQATQRVSPLGNSFKGLGKSTSCECVIDGNGSSESGGGIVPDLQVYMIMAEFDRYAWSNAQRLHPACTSTFGKVGRIQVHLLEPWRRKQPT